MKYATNKRSNASQRACIFSLKSENGADEIFLTRLVDAAIKAIEKKMRSFDRKAKKCTKAGDAMWASIHTGRVLGLLDARNIILETFKEQNP